MIGPKKLLKSIPRISGVLALVVHIACAAQPAPAPAPIDPQAIAASVLAGLPGTASVGVARKHLTSIALQGMGANDGPEPLFEIGSISKVFTGLLLAQAVEKHQLTMNDSLGAVLKSSVRFRSGRTASITLGQLVTHTSCLKSMPANTNAIPSGAQLVSYTRSELFDALGKAEIPRRRPCAAEYSNFGMAVLAETLSVRFGKPWEALVREQITEPLGMLNTFRALPAAQARRLARGYVGSVPSAPWEMDAFAGAGGLRSTTTDLLIFSKALMAGRRGPLGPAAERLVTPLAPFGRNGAHIGFAVILPAGNARTWRHTGLTGGHVAEWIVWPDRGEALVMLVSNLASPAPLIARALIQDPAK